MNIGVINSASPTPQAEPSPPESEFPAVPSAGAFKLFCTFLILLVSSWLCVALVRHTQGVTTICLSNGILFALVISQPRRLWLRYLLIGLSANIIANIVFGDTIPLAIGVSLANSFEVVSSCLLLTFWYGTPFHLSRHRMMVGFLVVAVLASTAAASAAGSFWVMLLLDPAHRHWWPLFRTWYLGDVLGMALIAPLVFIILRPGFFSIFHSGQLLRTVLILTLPAAATAAIFSCQSYPLTFFIFPVLLFVVFRLGLPGTVLAIVCIGFISIWLTATGHGPLMLMSSSTMLQRIIIAQVFVTTALLTVFPVASLLEQRKALELTLQKNEAMYRALANTDSLTALSNRRSFDDLLEAAWTRARRLHHPIALLIIDVDQFKAYNDTYGHLAGDEALRDLAGVIASTLRNHGIGSAFRFGGEEFAVILPDLHREDAANVAEHVRQAVIATHQEHTGNPLGVQTVSIGVAVTIPTPHETSRTLMVLSDQALYRAKKLGRNRVQMASEPEPLNARA